MALRASFVANIESTYVYFDKNLPESAKSEKELTTIPCSLPLLMSTSPRRVDSEEDVEDVPSLVELLKDQARRRKVPDPSALFNNVRPACACMPLTLDPQLTYNTFIVMPEIVQRLPGTRVKVRELAFPSPFLLATAHLAYFRLSCPLILHLQPLP
jgi:hypothetical protein